MIKVVLVDDEPFLLKMVENTIEWQKYEMMVIGTFFNGKQALDYVENNDVDVVISDIKMPVMDGKELITELKKIKPEVEFVVLSSYSEFELVRDFFRLGAFDYLTKIDIDSEQTANVLARLQKAVNKKKAAGGGAERLSRFLERAPLKLKLNAGETMAVMSIRIVNRNYLSDFNSFTDTLKERGIILLNQNDGEAVILLKGTTELNNRVQEIHAKTLLVPYKILTGVSSTGLQDSAAQLLEEAEKSANYSFYLNGEAVTYQNIAEIEKGVQVTSAAVLDMCKNYINRNMENLNLMKITDKIAEFFDIYKLWNLPYRELLEGSREIFVYLNYLLKEGGSIDSILEHKLEQVLSVIDDIDSFDKLKVVLMEYLKTISAGIHQEGSGGLIERICYYINSNYDKDLSLKAIAKQFGISENYLSRLFVKERNITFKRYINTLKLEKAKDYLDNTSLRIGEICEQLGYRNVEHFSRLFKEEVGISPSEYRKLCK